MAEKKAAGKEVSRLFLTLGLDVKQLENGLASANAEIQRNMNRWNREKNIIRLKMEADVAGLDAVKDKAKILEIQEKALNEILARQQSRLQAISARYHDLAASEGTSTAASQRLQAQMERERLSVARLEQELRQLRSQQQAAPHQNPYAAGYASLKGNVSGMIGNVSGRFQELQAATSSADSAIMAAMNTLGSSIPGWGKAAVAIAAVPVVLHHVEESLAEIAKPAATAGEALFDLSRTMNTTIGDAGRIKSAAAIAGTDINSLVSAVKRLESTYLSAGDNGNALTRTLERWNVSIVDANGNLLPFEKMLENLAEGFQKAERAGQGEAYLLQTLGLRGQEAARLLRDFSTYWEKAGNLKGNGVLDPGLAKEVAVQFRELEEQTKKTKGAFQAAFLPVANETLPKLISLQRTLSELIAENKGEIRGFGQALAQAIGAMEKPFSITATLLSDVKKHINDVNKLSQKQAVQNSQTFDEYVNNRTHGNFNYLSMANPMAKEHAEFLYRKEYDAIVNAQKEAEERAAEKRRNAQISAGQQIERASLSTAPTEEELKRIEDLTRETEQTQTQIVEAQTQARIAALNREKAERVAAAKNDEERTAAVLSVEEELTNIAEAEAQKRIDALKKEAEEKKALARTEEEREAIARNLEATITQVVEQEAQRRTQIIQDSLERARRFMQDAEDRMYTLTHSSYEAQLQQIERWKDAQLEKAETAEEVAAIIHDAAAREAEAFEREVDRMQSRLENAEDRLMRLTLSERDYDLYRARKQYRQDLSDGIPEGMASAIYNATLKKINERSREGSKRSYREKSSGKLSAVEDPSKYFVEFGSASRQAANSMEDASKYFIEFSSTARNGMEGTSQQIAEFGNSLNAAVSQTEAGLGMMDTRAEALSRTIGSVSDGAMQLVSEIENEKSARINAVSAVGESSRALDRAAKNWADNAAGAERNGMTGSAPQMPTDTGAADGGINRDIAFQMMTMQEIEKQGQGQQQMMIEQVKSSMENIAVQNDRVAQGLTMAAESRAHVLQPQVTVSPSINVSLGGAYVFDNAMKQQLESDITDKVSNGVKEAAMSAMSSVNLGYGG